MGPGSISLDSTSQEILWRLLRKLFSKVNFGCLNQSQQIKRTIKSLIDQVGIQKLLFCYDYFKFLLHFLLSVGNLVDLVRNWLWDNGHGDAYMTKMSILHIII